MEVLDQCTAGLTVLQPDYCEATLDEVLGGGGTSGRRWPVVY